MPGVHCSCACSFCSWCCWTKWGYWVNIRFYHLEWGMRKGDESKISFCYLRSLRASLQAYPKQGGIILCVCSQWWLVFPGGWCQLVIEHSVVVWLQVLNQHNLRLNPMVNQFSISILSNLCSESAGPWNFEILVEDYDTGPYATSKLA